ncbi:development of secondary female sexual characteriztics [Desmophyllum pertusum]|uniref:Development of secondary female sexual characteriztics n=1 Tax=Desmophyllum pertusum TaxID=174260 RepID=A0A9W9Z6H3_9CNID|nr:development of secondary female sexual characteriztics [Desmophyllum pertusum]
MQRSQRAYVPRSRFCYEVLCEKRSLIGCSLRTGMTQYHGATKRHIQVSVATDASSSGWGATIISPNHRQIFDYWSREEYTWDIATKEAIAINKMLLSCSDEVRNARVDVQIIQQMVPLDTDPLRITALQELPLVAKLFVPSVRCPVCSRANDSDFRFCQHCGYKRKIFSLVKKSDTLKLDLDSIDKRLQQLLNFDQATSYSRQKDSLQKELEAFLSALPGQLAKVLNPSGASAKLASSEVMNVNNTWTDMNELKRFLGAFPSGEETAQIPSDNAKQTEAKNKPAVCTVRGDTKTIKMKFGKNKQAGQFNGHQFNR